MYTVDFTGKNVLITGAGSGLALETALVLADSGANIIGGDINTAGLDDMADKVTKMGVKAITQKTDVTKLTEVEALFATAKKEFGKLDIVINGAGIGPLSNLETTTEEEFRRIMDINLFGVEFGSRQALLAMKEQGYGTVLNFASIAAWVYPAINPHYAVSKMAVVSLTRQYAKYAAPMGIRFNIMCPGIIRTPMWEAGLESLHALTGRSKEDIWDETVTRAIPMGIPQEPIDIANAAVFLVSDKARYITGQSISVDGGQAMH